MWIRVARRKTAGPGERRPRGRLLVCEDGTAPGRDGPGRGGGRWTAGILGPLPLGGDALFALRRRTWSARRRCRTRPFQTGPGNTRCRAARPRRARTLGATLIALERHAALGVSDVHQVPARQAAWALVVYLAHVSVGAVHIGPRACSTHHAVRNPLATLRMPRARRAPEPPSGPERRPPEDEWVPAGADWASSS